MTKIENNVIKTKTCNITIHKIVKDLPKRVAFRRQLEVDKLLLAEKLLVHFDRR